MIKKELLKQRQFLYNLKWEFKHRKHYLPAFEDWFKRMYKQLNKELKSAT